MDIFPKWPAMDYSSYSESQTYGLSTFLRVVQYIEIMNQNNYKAQLNKIMYEICSCAFCYIYRVGSRIVFDGVRFD